MRNSMQKLFVVLFVVFMMPAVALASYDTATIKSLEPNQNSPGTFRMTVVFSGNAGEPDVVKETVVDGSATPATVQAWAKAKVAELNSVDTAVKNPSLQPGRTINLNGGGSPGPTAFQVWQQKAYRLLRLKQLGVTNATAVTEVSALEKEVNDTYQPGYAAQF